MAIPAAVLPSLQLLPLRVPATATLRPQATAVAIAAAVATVVVAAAAEVAAAAAEVVAAEVAAKFSNRPVTSDRAIFYRKRPV